MPLDPSLPPSLPPAGTVASFQNALPAGHLVDGWRIDRVVAASATAVVYLATEVQRGTVVALKEYMPARWARREDSGGVVPVDAAKFERGLKGFVDAAQLLARCRQVGLVPVLGVSLAHGTAYQAMPWIAGTSLRELRVAMPGPPDEAALRALLDDLLDALAAIHATGSIHGGVDPAEVLLLRDDRAVLLGPGSAAREGAPGEFAAPEQSDPAGGAVPGPWSDLYALAALARFCIVGEGGQGSAALPPARYSAALLAVIEQALSPQVAARPQSVAAFRAALAGPAPVPETAASGITLDAERARIKRVVDSINFDEDAEELPRTDGLGRRPLPVSVPVSVPVPGAAARPARVPGAPPPTPARAPRRRAAVIAGAAVLAALGGWALWHSSTPGQAPLPPRVAAASAVASVPASAAKPSVEDSLAIAAAVLAAASAPDFAAPATEEPASGPAASAPAASSSAASAPEAVAAAPVAIAAASAIAKPRPVKRAAAAPSPNKTAVNPRATCSGRSDFALYRCMKTQCAQARWTTHPQCVRLRRTDRVDG